MELNNQHLRVMLSESEMQGLTPEGIFVVYSPFVGIESDRAVTLFNQVRIGLQDYFNKNQEANGGEVNVNAISFMHIALDSVVLSGLAEVLLFIWICGLQYKSAEMKLEAMKLEESREITEEQGSIIERCVQMDNDLANISAMVAKLPVPQFWPELTQWTAEFNALLDKHQKLIRSFM